MRCHLQAMPLGRRTAADPQNDDVEAWRLLREVSDYAGTRENLLILKGVGDVS